MDAPRDKEAFSPGIGHALELKIPPALLVVFFALSMWGATVLVSSLTFAYVVRFWTVSGLVLAGVGLAMAGVFSFRKSKTTLDPREPNKSQALVTSGIYRFSRNPMYAGFFLCLAAWAAYLSNLLAFAFLPFFVVYMNRFQIGPEERALQGKFGSAFDRYLRSVPRWF